MLLHSTVFSLPAPAVRLCTWYSYKNLYNTFLKFYWDPVFIQWSAGWGELNDEPLLGLSHCPIYSSVLDFTWGGLVDPPSARLWRPRLFRRFSVKGTLLELAYHNSCHLPNFLTFTEVLLRSSCFCVSQQTLSLYEQAFQKRTCTLAAVTLSRRKPFSLTWQDPLTNSSRKSSCTTLLTPERVGRK